MKACAVIVVLAVLSTSALGQTPGQSTHVAPTRTEMRITTANEAIRKDPERYQAYDDLAYNLVKRSEETSDRADLEKAGQHSRSRLRLRLKTSRARRRTYLSFSKNTNIPRRSMRRKL